MTSANLDEFINVTKSKSNYLMDDFGMDVTDTHANAFCFNAILVFIKF